MPSIAVFGAGPGLGRAVAHRYVRAGYAVALVARRPEPLARLAAEVTDAGGTAHAVPADLTDPDGMPALAARIRDAVGDPDTVYYGPTAGTALAAATVTPRDLEAVMAVGLYSPVALVHEFLPHMTRNRRGAILVAAGASAWRGMPNLTGPGPAGAALRNYLQSLQGEVAGDGVRVARLYIGAPIANSAWHARILAEQAAGRPAPRWGGGEAVDPDHLAELLWTMQHTADQHEAVYPESIAQ